MRTKFATLGVTSRPSLAISSVSQASHFVVVGDRALDMAGILDRRDAGGDGGGIDVERPADAVDRIDHMGRPVHPAEPERSEPMDLGEGPAHHDVFRGRHQLDAGFVVVAPDVFGIGGIEHQ